MLVRALKMGGGGGYQLDHRGGMETAKLEVIGGGTQEEVLEPGQLERLSSSLRGIQLPPQLWWSYSSETSN